MTDDQIEEVIEATTPPPDERWTAPFKRLATWFVATRMGKWATDKTARWQTIVAIVVVASGYPLVIASIGATNENVRAFDQRQTANALYRAQVSAHDTKITAYGFCLDIIAAELKDRERWENLVTFVAGFSPNAQEFADGLRASLLSDDPPTTDSCTKPGAAPIPPN